MLQTKSGNLADIKSPMFISIPEDTAFGTPHATADSLWVVRGRMERHVQSGVEPPCKGVIVMTTGLSVEFRTG